MDLSNFSTILAILGAYFAVVFVLAVSVETILEPFTSLPWLRKRSNPDEILKEIKEWLPVDSDEEAKIVAIKKLTEEYKESEEQLKVTVDDLKEIVDQVLKSLGPQSKVTQLQKDLALYLAALRRKYVLSEKQRISILRVLSAVIGMTIAIMLKIDTFDILGVLLPPDVQGILTRPNAQLGGMLVTGLAASAGSSFWHDVLSRVRNLKDTVHQVAQLQVVRKDE